MFPARALLLLTAFCFASTAFADDVPFRAPRGSVSLTGGGAYRNVGLAKGPYQQTINTSFQGFSPTLLRLRGDFYFLDWLGVEGEGVLDLFKNTESQSMKTSVNATGIDARLGVTARYVNDAGFVLFGGVAFGYSAAPIVRYPNGFVADPPTNQSLNSLGPAFRLGLSFTRSAFEGSLAATGLIGIGGDHLSNVEPQLFLGWRFLELDALALTAGLDVGAHLEFGGESQQGTGTPAYRGFGVRTALGLKVTFLPPRPLAVIGEKQQLATSVRVQVQLPDGAPALGASVSVDGTTAVTTDAKAELVLPLKSGSHSATATLAGHRPATSTAQVPEGLETLLVIRLQALTGPGRLSGVVQAAATSKPVLDATVTVGDAPPVHTAADGAFVFAAVGPGPVKVRVEAQGFNTTEEVAQVPPEGAATLDVALEALGKGSPATVRGLIRSRTGEPLTASVVIKGLATKVPVTAEGRFVVTVPGGQYFFIISAPGYVSQTKKVVLADGDQAIFHTELQKVGK